MRLSQKLMALAIIPILIFTLLTYLYIIPETRKNIYTEKDLQLQSQVENVKSVIAYFYSLAENSILTTEEAQRQAIELTSAMRYGENGYFWIDDQSHINVMHGDQPQTVGKDRGDLQDIYGTYNVREYVQGAAEHPDEGYYLNLWYTKPDAPEKPLYRRVYAKLFAPWGWIICTGMSIANVENTITPTVQALLLINTLLIVIVLPLIFWFSKKSIIKPLDHVINKINQMASRSGDLTQTINVKRHDEIGLLAKAVNGLITNLRQLIGEIDRVSGQAATASQELTDNAQLSAMVAGHVAASIEQTASGAEQQLIVVTQALERVETITSGIAAGATNATATAELANQTAEHANAGAEAVDTTIRQMHQIEARVAESARLVTELGEQSGEVGKIIETIAAIARQTNLLALNAAIEASRAGEHGRGFKVVAGEVRKLAEASHTATRQIADLIHSVQSKTEMVVTTIVNGNSEVQKGAESVEQAGQAFKNISSQVVQVAQTNTETAEALAGLAAHSRQVLDAVQEVENIGREITTQTQQIAAATQEQSTATESIVASSRSLDSLATKLHDNLGQFTV